MSLLFDFFTHYLFSKRSGAVIKKIAWMSLVGLLVSVACLIVVISVMNALNRHTEERMLSVVPHLMVEMPDVKSTELLWAHPLVVKLQADPKVKLEVTESQDLILRTFNGRFQGSEARGMSSSHLNERLREIKKVKDKVGGYIPDLDMSLSPGEIIIGATLARALGVFEGESVMAVAPESLLLPVGEVPRFERLNIKQIIVTNVADVDSQSLLYVTGDTLKSFRDSLSLKRRVEIWLTELSALDAIRSDILTNYPGAVVKTWKELDSALFMALRLEKLAIAIFLSLSGLIASFSLISLVILLISQKRKEIGLLLSIGFSKQRIRQLFFSIGTTLGVSGVLAGAILGSAIAFYIEKNPLKVLDESVYHDSTIPAYVDGSFVLTVVVVASVICLLGSYLASYQASREEPSSALRAKN